MGLTRRESVPTEAANPFQRSQCLVVHRELSPDCPDGSLGSPRTFTLGSAPIVRDPLTSSFTWSSTEFKAIVMEKFLESVVFTIVSTFGTESEARAAKRAGQAARFVG